MNTALIESATATMRAAVLTGPHTLAVRETERPEPGPGQVRVRLEGCGVCGSNLPAWQGRQWFEYPFAPGAPGHEGWGVVDEIGEDVTQLAVGDRVACLSYHAFAEHDIADADAAVKLPGALRDLPFPGEALGCAMNVFRRSGIHRGQHVAVVGVGFLGGLLIQLAQAAGARVYGITRRPFARDLALRIGAAEVIDGDDHERTQCAISGLTDGRGCDVVIEATGHQGPLNLAASLTAERGRLSVAGFHQDGLRTVDMQSWNWKGIDVINAHERDAQMYVRGMEDAISAVLEGRLDPRPLFTHVLPLDEIDQAFALLDERPEGFMKALVVMS